MKEIIATEKIFSPITNVKPIAIRYHYIDGTYKDVPVGSKENKEESQKALDIKKNT